MPFYARSPIIKVLIFFLLVVGSSLIHPSEASAKSFPYFTRYRVDISLRDGHGDNYQLGERATFNIEIKKAVLRFSWLRRRFYYKYYYVNIPAKNILATYPDNSSVVKLTNIGTGRYEYQTPEFEELGSKTLTVKIIIKYWFWYYFILTKDSYTIYVQGPPDIEITYPDDGSLFNVSTINVSGTINDNDADVEVNGVEAFLENGQFTAEGIQLEEGENQIIASATNPFGEGEDSITVTLDTTPPRIEINSPEDGQTLDSSPITVTGTTDDPEATIRVNGIPAAVNNGVFTAQGIVLVEGENQITVIARDPVGNQTSVTITVMFNIDPPPPIIPESGFITGCVYNARTRAPLQGASISVNGIDGQVISNNEGKYRFPINDYPEEGIRKVEVVVSKDDFTTCYRKVKVTSTRYTYVEPVYLTPIDPAVTVVQPDIENEQRHVSADGTVELIFPPGSVPHEVEVTATNFQHSCELPEELPDTTFFTYCVDLQPGVEFNEPVTLRVLNELGFVPGTEIPIGVYNEETLKWEDTGLKGMVTEDGEWVEAQLEHFTPYDINLPPPRKAPPLEGDQQTPQTQDPNKEANVPKCRIGIKTGGFGIDHKLPSIRNLGNPQALSMTYSSKTAYPNIFIDTEIYNNDNLRLGIVHPDKIKWELEIEGTHHEYFYDGASGYLRFPYIYNCTDLNGDILPTGRYSYDAKISNVYTNATYWTADSFGGPPILATGVRLREPLLCTKEYSGHFIVSNQQDSPFGSGWGLKGLQRLQCDPDGTAVIIDGDGSSVAFDYGEYIYGFRHTIGSPNPFVVIDPDSYNQIDTIHLNRNISEILISPDGRYAYLGGVSISVLDIYKKNIIIDRIDGSGNASDMILSPDRDKVYVIDSWSGEFDIIDIEENVIENTIRIGERLRRPQIAVGSRLDRAYLAAGSFYIIDPIAQNVVQTIPMEQAVSVAVTPDDRYAYLALGSSNSIPVIDLNANIVVANILIPVDPGVEIYPGLVIMHPDGDRVYVGAGIYTPTDIPGRNIYHEEIIVIDVVTQMITLRIRLDNEGNQIMTAELLGHFMFNNNGRKLFLYGPLVIVDTDPLSPGFHTAEPAELFYGNMFAGISPVPIFYAPQGESSYLIKNPNNTYTRFYKNGNQVHFNENGLHTSTVDRNGNIINYNYNDEDRLIAATYPGDQTYTFQYNPDTGKIASITDPVGRVTQIQIDGEGNLVQITNPDDTIKHYTYDARHLMVSTTNTRGQSYRFEYDDQYGRIQQTIDPEITVIEDGVERRTELATQFQPQNLQHLINELPPDVGTEDNPVPVVRSEDLQAEVTDPRGNSYTARLDRFGRFLEYTDNLGRTTQITRDKDGNPTQIVRPNGIEINMTFDGLGNLTSYTEEEIVAEPEEEPEEIPLVEGLRITTLLTYNLDFSQVTSIIDPLENETTIDYDENGNPITITDAIDNEINITWNEQGKPLTITRHLEGEEITNTFTYYLETGNLHTITNPEGETTTVTYGNIGNITQVEDAMGRITRYTYNPDNNRLIQTEDTLGNITQYQYDSTGNLTQITDANNNIIQFDYNEIGQLTNITNPEEAEKHFWYDPAGNLVKIRDYNGEEITYVYDQVNRLREKHWRDGEVTAYSYNNLDKLTGVTNPYSELQFNYDPIGRLIQTLTIVGEHQPATNINYTYDKNDNRLTLHEATLGILIYSWDALNRLRELRDFNDLTTTFTYDSLSRRNNLNISDILTTIYQYDNASRLTDIIYQPQAISYNYIYNDVGNRTSFTEPLGEHNYDYDHIDQLTQATHPQFPEENFEYDPLGNRNPQENIYNESNRLTEDEQYRYTYSANGNLITKEDIDTEESTNYTYNVENQLIQVDLPDGTTVNYYYDGLGRRIEKNIVTEDAEDITRFIYDGMDVLAEYNANNELIQSYVHSPSIDEPLQLTTQNEEPTTYYYISDGLGSITAITNAAGEIIEQYRYDSFGNVTILNALNEEISESACNNEYMFTARRYDVEIGLHYYRLRYYDPLVGRFLQEDPIGYLLGPNLYAYVNNNPVNWIDPWGLYVYQSHRELSKTVPTDNPVVSHTYVTSTDTDPNTGGQVVTDTYSYGNESYGKWYHNNPDDVAAAQAGLDSEVGQIYQGGEELEPFVQETYNKLKQHPKEYELYEYNCKHAAQELLEKSRNRANGIKEN